MTDDFLNSTPEQTKTSDLPPKGMALLTRLRSKTARVGVIGLGYVGLPLAITAAARGNPVTGFEIDPEKIASLDAGTSYIAAVTQEALEGVRNKGFDWSADFSGLKTCDVIVICVPTPLSSHREPDLSYVENTARTIASHLSPETLVVLESTTYPGTADDVMTPILEESGLSAGQDFFVASSPEREDPGNTSFHTATIPKIVGGDGEMANLLAQQFYSGVVDRVVPVPNTRTAEAIKITENIFRAVNIGLVNELKVIYDAMGIDIWDVIDGAATKPFGFMPFYPGPGLGGHCIPIDPFYLTWKAREHDLATRFIELAGEVNFSMPRYVISRMRDVIDRVHGRGMRDAKVLIVGIAYKKNVTDMRESPSMRIMELLHDQQVNVDYLDPLVPVVPEMRDYPQFANKTSVVPGDVATAGYDAIIIATDHDDVDYAALATTGIPIIDTRNVFARRGLPMDTVTKA
jgi:UDP-N-acetyl-D-glucosamine dehydrogenase